MGTLRIEFPARYPARFLKQVVTMFASINRPEFMDFHPELRRFVLDREAVGLPPRYQIYLALTHLTGAYFEWLD